VTFAARRRRRYLIIDVGAPVPETPVATGTDQTEDAAPSEGAEEPESAAPRRKRGRVVRFLEATLLGVLVGGGVLLIAHPAVLDRPAAALQGPPWLLPAAAAPALLGLLAGAILASRR
jgi:hypothetical protein